MRPIVYPLSAALLLLAALPSIGCGPAVTLRVLEPADVYVPAHVETVALVDRSRPGNAGEGVLGAIEGLFSGEALGVDTEGRREALDGLTMGLNNSPRFHVVRTITSRDEVESSLWDEGLSWAAAHALCDTLGCQGIVALEAFDSDSDVDIDRDTETYEDSDGNKRKRTVYEAERDTRVVVAWRLYDVDGERVVDDQRDHVVYESWTGKGDTESEARDRLPSQYDTVTQLARESGELYAARIAPSWVLVRRGYFASGDDRLAAAKDHVRNGDWEAARAIWLPLADDPDVKLRGKAEHNLALAAEVEGLLDRAVHFATLAAEHFPKSKVKSYLWELQRRLANTAVLDEQLEGAPGSD